MQNQNKGGINPHFNFFLNTLQIDMVYLLELLLSVLSLLTGLRLHHIYTVYLF